MSGTTEWNGTTQSSVYMPDMSYMQTGAYSSSAGARDRSRSPRRRDAGDRGDRDRDFLRRRDENPADSKYPEKDPELLLGKQHTQQDRRVYVGNLPYQIRWNELKDFMRQAGHVLYAEILELPNGLSKGCGIVEYSTRDEARRAVAMLSNQKLMGRLIYVREDREQEPKFSGTGINSEVRRSEGMGGEDESSRQLFVGNLPYSVRWQDLKDLFRKAGNVVRADVQMNHEGRSRGNGIVLMETVQEAQMAIRMFDSTDFMGRMIEVRLDRFARGGGRSGMAFSGPPAGAYGAGPAAAAPYMGQYGGPAGYNAGPNDFVDRAYANGPPSPIIHIGNLPWLTVDQDLLDLFNSFGKIERAAIAYEPSGRSRGFGVVQFQTTPEAASAIEKLNGYVYGNRPLQISYARYNTPYFAPPTSDGPAAASMPLPTGPRMGAAAGYTPADLSAAPTVPSLSALPRANSLPLGASPTASTSSLPSMAPAPTSTTTSAPSTASAVPYADLLTKVLPPTDASAALELLNSIQKQQQEQPRDEASKTEP
ncbi:RNA-binding protein [Schizosaccharomyces japonicus yFS275]|uniref:RNA-binding protein n=1 Tax=Schizosaccharomyces japonicus (strain yFS275 / FY16936) TaxID=402676 RepID=B6JY70_SCHJY|nr:RNA-binding protein [Schizosaccharomyces japonicus yFS275]EEB06488.2 RNA-binding protein [Schizosaccharomyces japonicus yFS275]